MRNCKKHIISCTLTLIIPTRARLSSKRIRSKYCLRFAVSNAPFLFAFLLLISWSHAHYLSRSMRCIFLLLTSIKVMREKKRETSCLTRMDCSSSPSVCRRFLVENVTHFACAIKAPANFFSTLEKLTRTKLCGRHPSCEWCNFCIHIEYSPNITIHNWFASQFSFNVVWTWWNWILQRWCLFIIKNLELSMNDVSAFAIHGIYPGDMFCSDACHKCSFISTIIAHRFQLFSLRKSSILEKMTKLSFDYVKARVQTD